MKAVARLAALGVLLASFLVAGTAPAHATADSRLSTRLATATWNAGVNSFSSCSAAGPAIVECDHHASTWDYALNLQTCAYLQGGGGPTAGFCNATFDGVTSGAGVASGEGTALACDTKGVLTGTFSIGGLAGSYPPIQVSISVDEGAGSYAGVGTALGTDGYTVLFQSVRGKFTLGCGSPVRGLRGASQGTWNVGALPA